MRCRRSLHTFYSFLSKGHPVTIKRTLSDCRFLLLVIDPLPCTLRNSATLVELVFYQIFACAVPDSCPIPLDCAQKTESMQCRACRIFHISQFPKLSFTYCQKVRSNHRFKFTSTLLHVIITCLNPAQTHWPVPRKQLKAHKLNQ